jgi:hypothetical protein
MGHNRQSTEAYKPNSSEGISPRGLFMAIRSSRAAKWVTIAGSSFFAANAAVAAPAQASSARSAAAGPNTYIPCNPNAPPNIPQLCGETRAQAEKSCAEVAETDQSLLHVKGGYVPNKRRRKYRDKFMELTPGGCIEAGKEIITAEEQIRDGAAGQFLVNGLVHFDAVNHGLDDRYPASVTISVKPYECGDMLPGSEDRPAIKVEWLPDPGWTTAGPTITTVPGAPAAIC